ncbi:eukaryotic translation initiation factor 3G1 [Forsythia ovata]|uniref:Eukaryotic translation initiation factor 3G1 n=1 Tax=Forsythia ovata TaxID=205694 RepID=A0ABD1X6A1_9LAMI
MAVEAAAPPSKLRWGELEEDDAEDLDFLLPPKQVFGPDENGIKRVVEYKFNDEGNKVKITTTTRIRKLASARLSKRAVERRSWSKFGDAVNEDVGSRLTMVSTEEIILERPRAPGTKQEEVKVAGDPLASMGKAGAAIMVCRKCFKKGEHWTAMCPYKDLAAPTETSIDKPPSSENTATSAGATKGSYIPPSMRAGAERTGTDMRRRHEENSVRVTNLSEDTREPDLHDLFRPFGSLRFYLGDVGNGAALKLDVNMIMGRLRIFTTSINLFVVVS